MDTSPITFLLLLLPLNLWVALKLPPREAEPVAGAIVMSLGIFGLATLPRLLPPGILAARLLSAETLIIWGILALSYLIAWRHPDFRARLGHPVGRFSAGTWVAGTAVLAELLVKSYPRLRAVAMSLGVIATLCWLWFMKLAFGGLGKIAAARGRLRTNGSLLLATVSTQSLVLLLDALFPHQLPLSPSRCLIISGYVLYAAGLALIALHWSQKRSWHHPSDWDSSFCIVHGAMSITGLAGIATAAVPGTITALTWVWSAAAFVLVETLDLVYHGQRVISRGWRHSVMDYDVSQWARVFTMGMFYAFTAALQAHESTARLLAAEGLGPAAALIAAYGQYVVLAVLLGQIAVLLYSRFHAIHR